MNLGAWAGDEPPDGSPASNAPSRTHLIVSRASGAPEARFLAWRAGVGPTRFGS